MCGIAGIWDYGGHGAGPETGRNLATPAHLRAMTGMLAHRGPDGSGIYLEDGLGLGHTRLSIIDLAGGAQPMTAESGLWIVFNGEIFNYPELRAELEGRGRRFVTSSDTEVLLAMYEAYGPESLHRLNGQFAFAVWDPHKRSLFLARDRLGILPLFYVQGPGWLAFASEIKPLLTLPFVERSFDPQVLDQVLTMWAPLPGGTVFQGVHELGPGQAMLCQHGECTRRTWWRPDFALEQPERSAGELAEEVLDLLEDAVRIRLRADVEVGCYLSGGLDSSSIAALMVQRLGQPTRSFGIRFADPRFDEGAHQQAMVRHLGCAHTELRVDAGEIASHFAELVRRCERPLLRTAPVPLFLLSAAVREAGITVVLTGEGADEVFAGYNIFREAKLRRFWARQPASTLRPLLIARLYPYIFDNPRLAAHLRAFFSQGMAETDDPFYSHRIRWRTSSRLHGFYAAELRQELAELGPNPDSLAADALVPLLPEGFAGWEGLGQAQYLEMALFMSGYLLSCQGDRVAMAHGVEARIPYLDHRLVELLGKVPARRKLPGLREKSLLRKAMAPVLPGFMIQRPKQPYRAPLPWDGKAQAEADALGAWLDPDRVRGAGVWQWERVAGYLARRKATAQPSEFDMLALPALVSVQVLHESCIASRPQPEPAAQARPVKIIDRRRQAA